jgi:hypothetical protein
MADVIRRPHELPEFIRPDELDDLLRLPQGRSKRLARYGHVPAVFLPDGTVRFARGVVESLLTSRRAGSLPLRLAQDAPLAPK